MATQAQQTSPPDGGLRPESDDVHRVLLVADEIFRPYDLVHELRSHLAEKEERVEVLVVAPALGHSAIDQELGNIDSALPEAGQRMNEILAGLREAGVVARGTIGDADPLVAIGDGLREYAADEIVVVTHVESESEQGEKGLSERLQTDFRQPLTHLKVSHPAPGGSAGDVAEVEHAPAHERTREEVIRETRNFPPLKKRDMAGILVGVIGTIALGIIAVAAGTKDEGELSGSAAVILLIAVGVFLLNVAHTVGLLFFESVRYTGIWERFMARASILVTGVGLVVSLVLWLTM